MEREQMRRSARSSKPSKKGGKNVKARSAEEEARRREAVKEALREKLELERRARQVVERLLDDSITEDFLVDCARFITCANYKDAVEERSIIKLCGYPICSNKLSKIPTQQYKISTKTNRVYDITERKCFCSNFCYKASKEFELQISKTPLWLRQHESPPEITLMTKGDRGSSGEEVRLAERRICEDDIDNPVPDNPEGSKSLKQHSSSGGLSHSDSSDGEQEQDFVSSMVSHRQGRSVHWGDLPKRSDEGDQREGGKMEGETDKEGILHQQSENVDQDRQLRVENRHDSLGYKTQLDAGKQLHTVSTGQPGEQQTPLEVKNILVEETTAKLNSCTITEPVTHTTLQPTDPTRTQDTSPVVSPPFTDTNSTESKAQLHVTTTSQDSQPDISITQVGMSKRGAAGLRDLLKQHTTGTKPDDIRQNLLEGLRRTLKEWRTEETLKFLYGTDFSSLIPPTDGTEEKEEEEELDEDDLEEVVEVEEGGTAARLPQEQNRPTAAAPDYKTLQKETQEQELRIREFYKGTWIVPEEANQQTKDSEVSAQDQGGKDPVLPLIDSQAQHVIQKRITVDKLNSCLRNIVGPLQLTMSDISTDLNSLVRTFRFTNTNIIHKTPEWTLIAVVLLHLLAEVLPVVREALESPVSVEYLNTLMKELSLQQDDLLSLVQLLKTPAL
ncbi:putative RNA polymerase II subunit B1 CTD phosphatase rpap2 [Myripristis murdjan]|nr:putative RNA polymerase II subunit B1 CTD phosphatase RPAP2 [Myripristis murdjan]XP_029930561.1 putative RNA polymerase II subunit B1 CTD phosphatase RPAP2 [Myripristis murdjan]